MGSWPTRLSPRDNTIPTGFRSEAGIRERINGCGGDLSIASAPGRGAKGALTKTADDAALVSAVRKVVRGLKTVSPEIHKMLTEEPPIAELSSRQAEILASITRGLTNKDIAAQLGISARNVDEHVNALFQKLGAANRAEAVAIALRKHLLKI